MARSEGVLLVTDRCVYLAHGDALTLLFWPSDRTMWDAATGEIKFANGDGAIISRRDGQEIAVGGSGGGGEGPDGGLSGAEIVEGLDWVVLPDPSCTLDPWWLVGGVE